MKYFKYDELHFPPNVEVTTHLTEMYDDFEHKHEYFEIFYVLNGKINHIVNGFKTALKIGDMVILRGLGKDVHTFERTEYCAHRDIMISPKLFKSACDFMKIGLYEEIMNQDNPVPTSLTTTQMNHIETMLENINNMPMSNWENRKPLSHGCVILLLSFLFQANEVQKSQYPFWFKQLLDRFTKTDFIKGGLPLITASLSYNKIYLCRVFKKYMGITMTDYLNNIRLNYSETYLRNTNMSITDVCMEIGFSSTSYFEKIFKEKYNMSPLKYKKLFK